MPRSSPRPPVGAAAASSPGVWRVVLIPRSISGRTTARVGGDHGFVMSWQTAMARSGHVASTRDLHRIGLSDVDIRMFVSYGLQRTLSVTASRFGA